MDRIKFVKFFVIYFFLLMLPANLGLAKEYINNEQIMNDIQKYTEEVTRIPTDYISYNSRGVAYSKLNKALSQQMVDFDEK